jgi:hypothetical protein
MRDYQFLKKDSAPWSVIKLVSGHFGDQRDSRHIYAAQITNHGHLLVIFVILVNVENINLVCATVFVTFTVHIKLNHLLHLDMNYFVLVILLLSKAPTSN